MERGMKWYKFLIYFVLWANAILNIAMGILQMTGKIYDMQGGSAADVYFVYPKMATLDKIYGIVLIGLGVYALITRFALAGYKSFAPLLLYGVYIINTIAPIVYAGIVAGILEISITELLEFTTIIVNAVMLFFNFSYFNKRSDLFTR